MARTHLASIVLTLCAVALATAGCGGDRTGTSPTGGSTLIKADEGGSVLVDGTETSLAIPANALTADTEVVLSVESPSGYPAAEGLREVIAMSPAGTDLVAPASLGWQPSGAALTGSESLSLLRFTDGGWLPVEASVSVGSGGIALTTITRLETYGLRVSTPIAGAGQIVGSVRHIYTGDPLPGISFTLYDNLENVIGTATSGTDGSFSFTEVPSGSYFIIAEVLPADNCFSDPTTKETAVSAGETAEVKFGFVPGPC
jgi:hypothetical protein